MTVLAQPGRREVRQRHYDKSYLVYRFDPTLPTMMQWEIVRIFKTLDEAKDFAFPKRLLLNGSMVH